MIADEYGWAFANVNMRPYYSEGGKTLGFTDKKGVALEGYDPVSYFTDGKPAKGDKKIEATFNGALYHFTSQEHRETFEKDPAKYAPAYGGYCGYAASIGKVRPANPLLWSIVDGQLIVQHTKGAAELWARDVHGNKMRADVNWPRLIEAKAGVKNPIDSLLGKSYLEKKLKLAVTGRNWRTVEKLATL